ncbi:hypothetical protein [Acidithiobacillus ferrooxidans]|uniref:hypothetical protein n=1 Tax=Acidithiobacillus ferrooxidans TaxID=920 RepID=UPI0013D6A0A2|nr:hypothetical protein [Acidithiobacillus ferrooxidans]
MSQDETKPTNWRIVPVKPTRQMGLAGRFAEAQGKGCEGIYEAMLAVSPQVPQGTIPSRLVAAPAEVMAALNRMCTPLDETYLKGITAQEDAKCMALIRDYILSVCTQSQ